MEDRFKYKIVVKTKIKTLTRHFDHVSIYPCNGFIQTKQKIKFRSGAKDFTFYSHQVVAILQSTGLKDKNGKLIYEGDICKNTDNDCILTYGKIGQIKFIQNQNQSCYDWQQSGNRHGIVLGMELAENLEIIGNIYETPELLEANNVNL